MPKNIFMQELPIIVIAYWVYYNLISSICYKIAHTMVLKLQWLGSLLIWIQSNILAVIKNWALKIKIF